MHGTLVALVAVAVTATGAMGQDWATWRGPHGDGTWVGITLPDRDPLAGLHTLWEKPLGGGYAGLAVADERVYAFDFHKIHPKPEKAPDGLEQIHCFRADNGKTLWVHRYPCWYGDLGGYANGPRAMPVVHDGKVYTLGAVGHACCLDAAKGHLIWQRDLVKEAKARVPTWGFAAAPVIVDDLVLLHVGAEPDGSLVALDRHTGREVWRSLPDPAGYCAPIVIDAPAGRQLVLWTPEHVRGLDPKTGELLWTIPYKVTYGVSIATPIYRDGVLFVTGYWEGSKAIRLGPGPRDAKLVWEDNKFLRGLMAQPLYRAGYVYTIDKGLGLVAFELLGGRKAWDDGNHLTPRGRNPHASIVWLGDSDRVLALNAVGEFVVAQLTPRGYQEIARRRVVEGKVWAHPAFSGRRVYLRTDGAEHAAAGGPFTLTCVAFPEP